MIQSKCSRPTGLPASSTSRASRTCRSSSRSCWLSSRVLVIGSAVYTAVRRRRHDVAVLRSMGADGRWLVRAGHWQAIAATLVPVAIGVPLGIVAGRLVFRVYADNLGTLNDAAMPLIVIALGVIALVAIAAIDRDRLPVVMPAGPPRPSCCAPSERYAGNASASAAAMSTER